MLSIENLGLSFGPRVLFNDVTLMLKPKNRYGLVGPNGAGKSSFIKLLAGQDQPSSGSIVTPKNARLGWMHQDHFFHEEERIVDVVLQGNKVLWAAMSEKETLLAKPELDEAACYRLGDLEAIIADNDGYVAESVAHELLVGLGVNPQDHEKPLSVLSGGYKLRVLLAQALFGNPDILLLDEPTNHLDILSISWLEGYLRDKYKGLLVLISHDYDFLNTLSTHILDVDYQDIRLYTGNFVTFEKEKVLVAAQREAEKKGAEEKIAHMQKYVDKFRATASKARQAQSRLKMIEKIEVPEIEASLRRAPNISFTVAHRGPKHVVKVAGVSKSFGAKKVLENVSFSILRGEKVAFIGANGVGKSTLLKVLSGHLESDAGQVHWGESANFSYFSQELHDIAHGDQTMLSWLMTEVPSVNENQARSLLGRLLFPKDAVHKTINVLSGGELCRLVLAKIILEQRNGLIMDEPTNHLDLESRQALALALSHYEGTVLVVSHDRHFIQAMASRVISMTPGKVESFQGTYSEYLEKSGTDYLQKK